MTPVEALKKELTKVKDGGGTTVPVDGLMRYLDGIEDAKGELLELRRLDHASRLAFESAIQQINLEAVRATNEAGKEALSSLVLISGGGVVAFLGFLGSLVSRDIEPALGRALANSLLLFGISVLCGCVGFGLRYVSQALYAERSKKWGTWGDCVNACSIAIAVGGYALFGTGMYRAYGAFLHQFGG